MFDVFALFFIGGIINSSINGFTDSFRVVMAHLVWNFPCYWMAYLLWNIMAFGFVISFILSYRVGLADAFGYIFASSGVGGIVNGMTFYNRFRVN